MIFRRSPDVPQLASYEDYRDPYLRPDFQHRCAYCLTHEQFFLDGEGGEIDHHRPLHPPPALGLDFSHLRNAYDNLYWTCGRCNRLKGNRWPTEAEYASGERFLDPCQEDHEDHLDIRPDGEIVPTTPTGRYTVLHIRLNRPALKRRRAELYHDQQTVTRIEAELTSADLSPEHRQALAEYVADVRARILPPAFRP